MIIGGAALLSLAAIVSAASGGAALEGSAPTNSGGGGGARSVVLSNVLPHTDARGIIDAHDGSIALLDGPRGREFYWYAMGYGYNLKTGKDDCPESGHWCINCGRHFNNTIGVWTSPDLSPSSWVRRAEAIGADWPSAMYYRSHALFNARTKKFVLWANVGAGPGGPYAVATSSSADGKRSCSLRFRVLSRS